MQLRVFAIILPPFWQTWWFRILIFSIIIGLVIFFFNARTNQLKVQQLKLEKLVNEKTDELTKQNENLKILSNEIEETNRKKITFFTNISHEFRTPLTLISNPLESIIASKESSPNNSKNLQVDDPKIRPLLPGARTPHQLHPSSFHSNISR